MSVKVIELDIAKQVFQVHAADAKGGSVLKKRLQRGQLTDFFAGIPKCIMAIEARRQHEEHIIWARVIARLAMKCG